MQPVRLKKIQSLDCSPAGATSQSQQQQQQQQPAGQQQQQQQRALMHSVSIVVELANVDQGGVATSGGAGGGGGGGANQSGSCGSESSRGSTSGGSSMEETTPGASGLEGQQENTTSVMVKSAVVSVGGGPLDRLVRRADCMSSLPSTIVVTSDDEEEEEGEEEIDEECLSSGLARRVVLVDEADKILLRNRAQSAEPQVLHKILADFHALRPGATPSARCSSASPPVGSFGRQSGMGVAGYQVGGSGGGGGGELAEHGALSKLGMRRNTHHHVVRSTSPPLGICDGGVTKNNVSQSLAQQATLTNQQALVMRASPQLSFNTSTTTTTNNYQHIDCSARQTQPTITTQKVPLHSRRSQVLTTTTTTTSKSSALQPPPPPIQHRRQSLQISLLSGLLSRDSGRSLTEEELRGEREFNEQVRCAARSPEVTTSSHVVSLHHHPHHHHLPSHHHHHQHHQLITTSPQQTTSTSTSPTSSSASDHQQAHNLVAGVNYRRRSSHVPRTSGDQEPLVCCQSSDSAATRDSEPLAKLEVSSQVASSSSNRNQLELSSASAAANRRRRVSFGAIDPIVLSYPDDDNNNDHELNNNNSRPIAQSPSCRPRQRASICNSLLSHHQPSTGSQLNSGILRRLERIAATSGLATASDKQSKQAPEAPPEEAIKESRGLDNQPEMMDASSSASSQQQQQRDAVRATASDPAACPRRARIASVGTPEQNSATTVTSTISGCTPTKAQQQQQLHDNNDDNREEKSVPRGRRQASKSIAGPAMPMASGNSDDNRVQSIMANARLRQEEFARLLEEHEQIVNEINRFETKISTAAAAGQQQQAEVLKRKQQDAETH